jgi:hypothetical protein
MRSCKVVVISGIAGVIGFWSAAHADLRDDVGYNRLINEFQLMLDGSGVPVAQVEANGGSGYFPETQSDPTGGSFAGKHFDFVTPPGDPSIGFSGHAARVAQNFYRSDTGLAPGVTQITAYALEGWANTVGNGADVTTTPAIPARVVNHSYLLSSAGSGYVPHYDYLTLHDDLVQVVAVNNNDVDPPAGDNMALAGGSKNAITVGRSDGHHASNDPTGPSVRTVPLLTAPEDTTSYAAPVVAGVAADLIQAAHGNPALSLGSHTTRNGLIYNGETSETIKALLLSGADRNGVTVPYVRNTSNGLNSRVGAGRVNIYNSYNELAAGEQDSQQRGNTHSITRWGFDYDSTVPLSTSGETTQEASYAFTSDLARKGIITSLAWNSGGTADADLNLYLLDTTNGSIVVAQSTSTVDNTENIYFTGLHNKHKYILKVRHTGIGPTQDYAIAWRFIPDNSIRVGITDGVYDIRYGDINGDGIVTPVDVDILAAHLGTKTDATWAAGDMNGDGAVDFTDFNYLCGGSTLPTGAALPQSGGSIVPEPVSLLAMMSCALMLRRRSARS